MALSQRSVDEKTAAQNIGAPIASIKAMQSVLSGYMEGKFTADQVIKESKKSATLRAKDMLTACEASQDESIKSSAQELKQELAKLHDQTAQLGPLEHLHVYLDSLWKDDSSMIAADADGFEFDVLKRLDNFIVLGTLGQQETTHVMQGL